MSAGSMILSAVSFALTVVFVIIITIYFLKLLPHQNNTKRRQRRTKETDEATFRKERISDLAERRTRTDHPRRLSAPDGRADDPGRRPTSRPEGRESSAESVLLGASVPVRVAPGGDFTARFVAYIQSFEAYLHKHLKERSSRSHFIKGFKECIWHTGTRVCVRCYGNNLIVEDAEREFVWQGTYEVVEFDVKVDAAARGTTVLKFDVIIGGFVIARLRVDVKVGDQTVRRQVVKARPARSAFASYASKDRTRVLDRVSEIQRNGVDVFTDCLSLHPGDPWKTKLATEIKKRQLFLLFWSVNARESEWVTWEWKTALKHKGLDAIEPHPLDPVTEAPPPQELSDLHFDDVYMLVRKAHDASKPSVPGDSPS